MTSIPSTTDAEPSAALHQNWIKSLGRYREPDEWRSAREIIVTAFPFLALWTSAWAALWIGYWLTLLLAIPAAGFMVRLFLIQHDCGHGAFFRRRPVNDWIGRVLGVLTLTPYDVWRRTHALHHASTGNLDRRGFGDIKTLTVREYTALSWLGRWRYRLYRNPIVMFGLGPAYLFLLQNRLPFGLMADGWGVWISAMGTNAGIVVVAVAMMAWLGIVPFLAVQIPITLLAATIGVWLFYVQHQFEETFWEEDKTWELQDAALLGSSHYVLPGVLRWFTANIGVHHVHHLSSRIPYYRLPQVLDDHPELAGVRRMTLWQSLSCLKLRLWDERSKRLVTFRQAHEAGSGG